MNEGLTRPRDSIARQALFFTRSQWLPREGSRDALGSREGIASAVEGETTDCDSHSVDGRGVSVGEAPAAWHAPPPSRAQKQWAKLDTAAARMVYHISPVRDHFVSKASMALEEGSPDRVSKCCAEGPAAAGKGS